MEKEIINSVFEKMKTKDFGESMCDETKLKVLKWCEKQLHKHGVIKSVCVHNWDKKYYEDGDYAMQCTKCKTVR